MAAQDRPLPDSRPGVAVLVSSYNRPRHLERVLASIECQQGVDHQLEVVVTDDGSNATVFEVVKRFAERVAFGVTWTTHPHSTYQLARCRNEGVAVSGADYLLFLDGDCLIPADHVRIHLDRRKPGVAMAGYCYLLGEAATDSISLEDVYRGRFTELVDQRQLRRLVKMDRKARFYEVLRHPTKPKLFGGNIGISRQDFERVNGYDERFQGWGCEDDDLRIRLRRAGIRVRSILRWTRTYHLWHPPGETTPSEWSHGPNVAYLRQRGRPLRCADGLAKYLTGETSIETVQWNEPLNCKGDGSRPTAPPHGGLHSP